MYLPLLVENKLFLLFLLTVFTKAALDLHLFLSMFSKTFIDPVYLLL